MSANTIMPTTEPSTDGTCQLKAQSSFLSDCSSLSLVFPIPGAYPKLQNEKTIPTTETVENPSSDNAPTSVPTNEAEPDVHEEETLTEVKVLNRAERRYQYRFSPNTASSGEIAQ